MNPDTQPHMVEHVRECVRRAWLVHNVCLQAKRNDNPLAVLAAAAARKTREKYLTSTRAYFLAGHKISLKGLR